MSKAVNPASVYTSEITRLNNDRVSQYRLLREGDSMSWSDVIDRWQQDRVFRDFFISILIEAPFPAYFFETPSVTYSTINDPFEFVLVDSPTLVGVSSDQHAFADHFALAQSDNSVIGFANLGGDAMLVVPCPGKPLSAYSQISEFSRHAPEDQQHRLWAAVGTTLEHQLGAEPVWVSTSGLGIYWLHIRLDSTPKYYTHTPYRDRVQS